MITYTCKQCGKQFKGLNCKEGKFCSRQCYFKSMVTGKIILCNNCGKENYVQKYDFIHKNHYCNKKCQMAKNRRDGHGRINPSIELKKQLLDKYNYTCGYCKKIKNEIMKPLQFHHIDGRVRNTVLENLIPICLSCHRRTQKKVPAIYE